MRGRCGSARIHAAGAVPGRPHDRTTGAIAGSGPHVDPSNQPAVYRGSIRDARSRVRVLLVIATALLVVALGVAGRLTTPGSDGTASPVPPADSPAAAATPRPTQAPTPGPTPMPTLAPMVAAATAAELAPSGVHVADFGDPAVGDLVADVNGTVWAIRAGAVINVNPRTGRSRAWTLADDPAFATAYLAPARRGGVWLVTEDAVRLFDGVRFRVVIETPAALWSMVEDADGTLWAQTGSYGLVRWADGTWTSDPPGRPTRGVANMVVDRGNRIWTVDFDDIPSDASFARSVSVWDGSWWTSFTLDDLPALRTAEWPGRSMIASSDGGVWLDLGRQLARFIGGSRATYDMAEFGILGASLKAVGEDGRLWFVREECGPSCGVRIQAFDGSTLTTYDEADGLPGADDVNWPGATVLPGPDYVLAATDAGLYRLTDGSWHQLGPETAAGAHALEAARRGAATTVAALSRDEVWLTTRSVDWDAAAPGDSGLFRYDGSAWRRWQLPVESTVGQAIRGPDGALWVATGSGPRVQRDGAWTDLGETVAALVPEPGEHGDGCGGVVFPGNGGVVYYAGPRSANRLVALRPVNGTWEAGLHPATPENLACTDTFVVTADGSIWRLQRGWGQFLSRWADGQWQAVSLPTGDEADMDAGPSAIVADGEGSLWVVANAWDTATGTNRADLLHLAAGEWIRHGGGDGVQIQALALLPDGSLIAVGDGVAVLRDRQWHQLWRGLWLGAVSVAPDGAVWVAGSNVYRLPPLLP
jgi:hypothetical protein